MICTAARLARMLKLIGPPPDCVYFAQNHIRVGDFSSAQLFLKFKKRGQQFVRADDVACAVFAVCIYDDLAVAKKGPKRQLSIARGREGRTQTAYYVPFAQPL
jgi:hypothetical protein